MRLKYFSSGSFLINLEYQEDNRSIRNLQTQKLELGVEQSTSQFVKQTYITQSINKSINCPILK